MNYAGKNRAVTRKAILIGAPSKGKSFLPGVRQDLVNIRLFLLSDNAGRWNESEILILNNPSVEEVLKVIHSTIVDYLFVYFSGHGAAFDNNRRVLELKNGFVWDNDLLNLCPRQLIVCDACGSFIGAGIGSIPAQTDEYFNFDGTYQARELFDSYILNSPFGRMIVHSTQVGEIALDSPNGGLFTLALLTISTQIKSERDYTPYLITDILHSVQTVLQKSRNVQIPAVYASGDLRIPFVFGMQRRAHISAREYLQHQSSGVNHESSNNGWLLFGLGVLALALISK